MYKKLLQPILFRIDPERAHHLTTGVGETLCALPVLRRYLTRRYLGKWPELEQTLLGIRFPLPVGVAAGFDKNANYPHLLRYCGFGFAEFGSITAQPSTGNATPRLFRLPDDQALINRMGLNNEGAEPICRRIETLKSHGYSSLRSFPAGLNIAKSHDPDITGTDAIHDYMDSYTEARRVADYITLNVSCPNTREGKTFEDQEALSALMDAIMHIHKPTDPPVFVKLSPDNTLEEIEDLIQTCEAYPVAGYVISNTSTNRSGLRTVTDRMGAGGLSGAPLFEKSLERVSHIRNQIPGHKILIGVGGIDNPQKAVKMLKAGANLLQVYTGFVYQGPSLIPSIYHHLGEVLKNEGASSISSWLQMHHP